MSMTHVSESVPVSTDKFALSEVSPFSLDFPGEHSVLGGSDSIV